MTRDSLEPRSRGSLSPKDGFAVFRDERGTESHDPCERALRAHEQMARGRCSLGLRSSAFLRPTCGGHGVPVAPARAKLSHHFRRPQKSSISKRLRKAQSILRSPSEARRASEDGPVQSHPSADSGGAYLNTAPDGHTHCCLSR